MRSCDNLYQFSGICRGRSLTFTINYTKIILFSTKNRRGCGDGKYCDEITEILQEIVYIIEYQEGR